MPKYNKEEKNLYFWYGNLFIEIMIINKKRTDSFYDLLDRINNVIDSLRVGKFEAIKQVINAVKSNKPVFYNSKITGKKIRKEMFDKGVENVEAIPGMSLMGVYDQFLIESIYRKNGFWKDGITSLTEHDEHLKEKDAEASRKETEKIKNWKRITEVDTLLKKIEQI